MRDPKRIERMMDKMKSIWLRYPDLRMFQLMSYFESKYAEKYPSYKKTNVMEKVNDNLVMPYPVIDLFSLEDDEFEAFLDAYIQENIENHPK